MSEAAPARMTADAFIEWSMKQPDGDRYELAGGEVVRMSPERVVHARTRFRVARLLIAAVEATGLDCEVFGDGMAVEVDRDTIYEPDALLRCGPALSDDVVTLTDPMVVVELVSPRPRSIDSGVKLADYFRLPSVRHYLVVRTKERTVIQHTRGSDGAILTRIVREGSIVLDPPGITQQTSRQRLQYANTATAQS